jgi:hypothetical protein
MLYHKRIQYAYMNPVLLCIIRDAFYGSTTSIARRTYQLFLKYPSLTRNLTVMGYTWKGGIPRNAFVMAAVAVSPLPISMTVIPTSTTIFSGSSGTQRMGKRFF